MYAGVDIGGTKTLVAALDDNGVILEKVRFETPKSYDNWVHELRFAAHKLSAHDFKAAGVGAPGKVDYKNDRVLWFGNLPWKNVPIHDDVGKALKCPVVVENDAKMAALSEAMMVKDTYDKVLYVTISTGIGFGLVVDQRIDQSLSDRGGTDILVPFKGKMTPWESFASGHAIVERYGKRAEDIKDAATWRAIARDLIPGLLELIAVTDPEIILFGGSVGHYFERYAKYLREDLKKAHLPVKPLPVLAEAKRPEDAVLYGCYDLAKQTFRKVPHALAR
jgi:predicted NBD/HSP70 family sugar kinase